MREKELVKKVQLFDEDMMNRALARISYEIMEKNDSLEDVVLVGILTRGLPLAKRIQTNIQKHSGIEVPVGSLDIHFYRDDLGKMGEMPHTTEKQLSFDVNGKNVVLVDDVLFTGRTVRAAIDALFDMGRPAKVQLAILVDRGHRELPIRPDYIGKNVPTSMQEVISVNLEEIDGITNIELLEKKK